MSISAKTYLGIVFFILSFVWPWMTLFDEKIKSKPKVKLLVSFILYLVGVIGLTHYLNLKKVWWLIGSLIFFGPLLSLSLYLLSKRFRDCVHEGLRKVRREIETWIA